MAGLLDEFGSWAATPQGQGLLSAAFAGLAGAKRGRPINSLGAAGLAGLQGYSQAQDQQQQTAFNQTRQKLLDSQLSENEWQAKARQQALEQQQAQRNYLGSIGQVTSPVIGAQPNQFDAMKALSLGMSPEMVKMVADAPNLGRAEVARTLEGQDAQGNKVTYQFDKFGRPVGDGVKGYTAPVQVDLGGRVQLVRPEAGVTLGKTMTPDGVAADRRAREAATRDSLSVTYQQDADGNFVALPNKIQPGSMVRGVPVVSGPGMLPLKGQQKDAKLTEGEGKATLYLGQMRSASEALSSLSKDGKTADPWQVAMTGGVAGNLLASSNAQQIGQAQNQWSEAYLRQKTGAAATKQEIDLNNRTFFPQMGDSSAVIKQKAEMRTKAEQGMEIPAGRGASRVGQPSASQQGGLKFLGFE